MKELVTERILHAYFESRATPHEKLLIKEWLRIEGNEEIFYQHLAVWEASHLQFTPDDEKAKERYRKFINDAPDAGKTRFHQSKSRKLFPWKQLRYASIAASVSLILGVVFYLSQDYLFFETHTTSYGMTKNILLEDGSEVTLNANSTLKVPNNLASLAMREVWLEGEAFFAIAKRPNHVRFSVHTGDLNVEVLGTKFNVNNRRGTTEVVLSEGSVKLTSHRSPNMPALYMKPGDFVSLSVNDTTFNRRIVEPEEYSVWQSNQLIFADTPLRVVAEKIEDYYGVHIDIADTAIASRQVTGTLPNNDLGVVLRALSTSHDLNVQREGDRIIFK